MFVAFYIDQKVPFTIDLPFTYSCPQESVTWFTPGRKVNDSADGDSMNSCRGPMHVNL